MKDLLGKEAFLRAIDPMRRYFLRMLHTVSQLINVLVFFGSNPAETLSSRCYRLKDQGDRVKPWRLLQICLDFIAKPFHAEHCKKSYETSLSHAFLLIDEQDPA
tara:strand:- start:139 stop:450 length:312 start_codon:yes stop_codon:yes gene_type:complete